MSLKKYSITLASFRKLEPLEITLARLSDLNFNAVEMYGEPAEFEIKKLKDIFGSFSLQVSGITGMWGKISKNGINRKLLSANQTIVTRAEEYVQQCIEMCSALGGQELNICLFADDPLDFDGTHGIIDEETKQKVSSRALPAMRRLSKLAVDSGVSLVIEPLNRYSTPYCKTASDALRLVRHLDGAGILLDTFHMNIEEDSYVDAILESKDYLKHCHFADNNRKMPGFGHIDFRTILSHLRKIGYKNFISFEPNIAYRNYDYAIKHSIEFLDKINGAVANDVVIA